MTKDTEALREALKDLARGVFIDAATITHHSWVDGTNGREPDFDEYAGDYAESFADAYVDNITAALATPASDVVAGGEALRDVLVSAACDGIADDYMTSEKHHPGYVLIPSAKFEAILAALKGPAA